MSITTEIWARFASETGLPFKEASEIGRRIREQGLFSKHTRAKESQVITDTDLANLIIAGMSGLPPQQSHLAVRRLADASVYNGDYKHIEQGRAAFEEFGAPMTAFLDREHTFTEAVAALFGMARKGPYVFEETFRHTWVSIDQRRFSGEIYLSAEIFTPLPKPVVDTLIEYVPSEEFFRGDLQIHARLTASTIASLARAADRVTP